MGKRVYTSEIKKHQVDAAWNFVRYSPGSGGSQAQQDQGKRFIRIFKDEVSEEMWSSYCMGLGLDTTDPSLKSFKIYIETPEDIQTDEYSESGEIIEHN